jgi:hypothetical protein
MKKTLILAAACLFTLLQATAANITDVLTQKGFEDIRVNIVDSVVYASVEPTAYRGTFRGAAIALEELDGYFPGYSRFELVVTEYQMPQVAVHAQRDSLDWQVRVDYQTSQILKYLENRPLNNSSAWRFDVTAYPMVSLDNHRFDVLYEYTVSIAPTIETTLWRGNRITLMPVLPIASNVFKSKPEGYIHVGIAAIQQEVFLSNCLKAQVSGGMFLGDLMGFNAALTYRAGNAVTFGLKAALLGDAYVEDDKYHFGSLDKVSVLGQASYYHAPTQIEAGLTGGRFVFGDYGARLDLTRHYGDYAIGVFGILTGGEYNAGFHFAIPVGGKCQKRKGDFRIMLPEFYDMEYNMESYFEYAEKKMGRQVETRPDVNHAAHYWQASYVEMYLRKYIQSNHQ